MVIVVANDHDSFELPYSDETAHRRLRSIYRINPSTIQLIENKTPLADVPLSAVSVRNY